MKIALAAVLGLTLLVPATATADGLPIIGVDGGDGVVSPDGAYRYLTFAAGHSTLVARVHVQGGEIRRHGTIPGRFTVPVVAYDGSTSGLSADGRRLVLIRPRTALAQKRTELAVLDTRPHLRRRIVLRGDFSFDAISPDGSTVYLIQYLSLTRKNFDPADYKVRALDTVGARLLPSPIVDPREPGEKMGGLPVTRVMSADGRWAYTLYSASEHPFIHALDTTGRSARCIDLDSLSARDDLFQMRLRLAGDGRRLEVVKHHKPELVVDTQSFAVTKPRAVAPVAPRRPAQPPGGGGAPIWPWIAAAGALFALLGLASARPLARMARTR